MARRRKGDTEKTLELIIGLIVRIPIAIMSILNWVFSGVTRLERRNTVQLQTIDLKEIDQMDGFTFEYYIAELLKKNGYKQVFVTSGSGDFGVDITAYKNNKKYAFQCKNYQSKLGVSSIQEVYSGAPKYNASLCVVITNSYFTSHAQELAKSLNVMLWDRSELARLIRFGKEDSRPKQPLKICQSNKIQDVYRIDTQIPVKDNFSIQSLSTSKELKNLQECTDIKERIVDIQEDFTMATTLGAGKYVFAVDIPEGKYNLRAISGSGMLKIQKLMNNGTWGEEWINFGVAKHCARTYHGLTLPKDKYFEITDNVVFEITRSTMIEIE